MISFTFFLKVLLSLIPVFSGTTCLMLVLISRRDTQTMNERKLKQIAAFYFAMAIAGWFLTFCYEFAPRIAVLGNVVCFLIYILISVIFFRIVRFLTRFDKKENFSPFHYFIPVLFCLILFIWSLFVPFDIQLQIVTGKAKYIPDGYESFTRVFTLKPLMRTLFGLIYNTMSIVVLIRYYKKANKPESLVRRPAQWVIFLIGLTLASYCSAVMAFFISSERKVDSWMIAPVVVSIVLQHLLLTYHIIRRQYLLYIIYNKPENSEGSVKRRHHSGNITQQKLENYFRIEKPYLQTDFKITDLVNIFDVSRATISGFINQTYGMNFNRYVNQWRLKELERLSALPIYNGQKLDEYVNKAGFRDRRQYNRVLKAIREIEKETDSKTNKKK